MSSDFATEFPTLARLALSDEHRQALRQGGFVAREQRGAGRAGGETAVPLWRPAACSLPRHIF